MSSIRLKVEAFAGTTIEGAARDLCALAWRVGILCEAGFNGVTLWAYPGGDPAQLVKAWSEQIERPAHLHRIAVARPPVERASETPECNCPGDGTKTPEFHAPNCPYRVVSSTVGGLKGHSE